MDDYKTQMRYAANADDKAADYLRKAANVLRKWRIFSNFEP